MESKNRLTLMSFVNYCAMHPEERFWEALKNWSGEGYILVSNVEPHHSGTVEDTFFREGKNV
jgi:hypothetical protein